MTDDAGRALFRPAAERSTRANVARTLLQASVFWALFVVVLPLAIAAAERALGLARSAPTGHVPFGLTLIVVFGALNVWAGLVMAVVGRGTPLPLDTARVLVVRGPYRFVRNPMAIGGLGAGLGVGVALSSPGVACMVVVGALLWHTVARPVEERDLAARFGDDYARYRGAVRNWWPRARPYDG